MRHLFKSKIICPYCDKPNHDSHDDLVSYSPEFESECGHCGKTFIVEAFNPAPDFSTVGDCETNNELPHVLVDELNFDGCRTFMCTKCFRTLYSEELAGAPGSVRKWSCAIPKKDWVIYDTF